MAASSLREVTPIPDKTFPMNTFLCRSIEPHWHEHLELVLVLRGSALFQLDGDFVEMHAGEIMFVNAKQVHSATPVTSDNENIAVVFNEVLVRNGGLDRIDDFYFVPLIENRISFPSFIRTDHPLCADLRETILEIANEFEHKQKAFDLFIKANFYKLFGLLFRNHFTNSFGEKRHDQQTTQFTALLTYLREHCTDSIQLSETARMVNMSPHYFCKVFKKITGKTLVEYLHILRVMRAEQLLVETDLPVSIIANEVGFGSATYFGRIFKKHKNCMPSEFRHRAFPISKGPHLR